MISLVKTVRRKHGTCTAGMLMLSVLTVTASPDRPDAGKILRLSLAATEANWRLQPKMIDIECDADSRDGRTTSKTYQVMMIDGTPYDRLIARDGKPIPADEMVKQAELLREECGKRANQSADERARRVAKYRHSRRRMLDMMREMTKALVFAVTGESQVNGCRVYVLRATPRPGYRPPNHEAKVLTAMQGTLWIDEASYQWVRAEAEVTRPVWFGLFLVKVYPGTRFLLEQAPVEGGVWMPAHFRMQIKSSILLLHKDFTHDETYHDYRVMSPRRADDRSIIDTVNPN